MTDTEILKLFLKDCVGVNYFICDELGPSNWCENHCNQDCPDIECLRKYYSELVKPFDEGK